MSESIYAWIAPDPVVPEKPALYRSTHAHNAPLVGSTIKVVKGAHSHLGQTRAQLMATVQPENYLRARQNSGRAMDASVLREFSCCLFARSRFWLAFSHFLLPAPLPRSSPAPQDSVQGAAGAPYV